MMSWQRRLELLCGVASGTVGLVLLSVVARVVLPIAIVVGGILAGIAVGAVQHSLRASTTGETLLWTCTALLFGITLLAALSIGVFLLPSVALALVASVLATMWVDERSTAVP